jgi:tetratricopeptide (TPR) repeat protein
MFIGFILCAHRAHEEYQPILENSSPVQGNIFEQQNKVIDLFIQAVKINPRDADLHAVLGVLWNLTREYDKAEEAFKTAVSIDTSNYSFWNKLGATQANSPRPDGSKDAVYAYRQALERKPNYVRAWVNMGISYANQRKYNLAAKYYLKALRYVGTMIIYNSKIGPLNRSILNCYFSTKFES